MGRQIVDQQDAVITARFARIEMVGDYVRLTARCGDCRRVTPETARKIAANLLKAADCVEEWQKFRERPGVAQGLAKLDELEAKQ